MIPAFLMIAAMQQPLPQEIRTVRPAPSEGSTVQTGREVVVQFFSKLAKPDASDLVAVPNRLVLGVLAAGREYASFELVRGSREVRIVTDVPSRRVVHYNDAAEYRAVAAASEKGLPHQVTAPQAAATARAYLEYSNPGPGDWRLADLREVESGNGATQWNAYFMRYHNGYRCALDTTLVSLSPYDGSLLSLIACTAAQYPSQVREPIGVEAAVSRARDAWKRFGGPDSIQPDLQSNSAEWAQVSYRQPLCRLAYRFRFQTLDATSLLRTPTVYEVLVDGETGEIWHVRRTTRTASQVVAEHPVRTSPRIRLIDTLQADRSLMPVAAALAAGTAVKAESAQPVGAAVEIKIGAESASFQLGGDGTTLYWKRGSDPWAALRLPDAEAAAVRKWFAAR